MNGVQAAVFGGSAMILLILALRLLFGKHLPRRLFPALWCMTALRLLTPAAIPTRLSIWNLLYAQTGAQAGGVISNARTSFPALVADNAAQRASDAAEGRPMLLVWLVCAAFFAAYFAIGYILMVRRFRGTRLEPQPPIDALLACFRFSRGPRICVSRSRRAPLTFGILNPTVLLPEDLPVGGAKFPLVLAHELAHVRRKDCLRKLLLTVCLCLYWWNPLVWLMVRLANRDMELACDEAVLRALGPDCKKAYALALLDMAQRNPKPAPLCSGFAKSGAEERIRAILHFRRVPTWAGVCAAIFFALAASVFATQAASPAAISEQNAVMQAELPRETGIAPVQNTAPPTPSVPQTAQDEASNGQPDAPAYVWPLEDANAAVTDAFGYRTHTLTGQQSFHAGVDLAAEAGENVLAVADGTVVSCEYDEAYGYFLTLAHADGVQTQYAHLQEFLVQPGDAVLQGQVVALVGATGWTTGAHLHLNVRINGELADPLDALKSK